MGLEHVIERLWPGRPAEVEQLGGGLTNHNFRVVVDGEAYVLRIGGKDTELLGIDRDAEYHAALVAAELGIGPEVVEFVQPEGCLVTRYVAGQQVPIGPGTIERVGAVLRTLHGGAAFPGRFDSFRVVETYLRTARAHGVAEPSRYGWAHQIAARIERTRGDVRPVPCHNDLLNANFIDDGERIRIVDWEYAGMGDPFFDLANFSVNHELEEEQDRVLLIAYSGAAYEADLAALTLMRFMSDFREAMWGVVQQGISGLDFDFAAYADEHFSRLERTAASARFTRALVR